MTPVTTFLGKRVGLFGLGGSGVATARALIAGGAEVFAWDDGAAGRERAAEIGAQLLDLTTADLSEFAAIVLAPGVPLTHPAPHPVVLRAQAAGVAIIGDIELFARERRASAPGAPFVAITGTNGKSTTTALIAHILREAGRDVAMGGNIGVAILDLPPPAPERVHVIECSSFQIDLAPSLDPLIGALLNVTPDHLDRHGTMERYAAIKERLIAGADHAIVDADDDWCRAVAARREASGRRLTRISATMILRDGVMAIDGRIAVAHAGALRIVADLAGVETLRGVHNAQNACAAVAVCAALGLDDSAIAAGIASFPGLAHRLEPIGRLGRVRFINDSKATNADSTQKALSAFAGDIHWIVGGKAKEGGVAALRPLFARVARAYLIGAASEAFAATLEGHAPYERCGAIDVAVARAAAAASASDAPEPVVLLSPACASYDQFPNFEVRGEYFRACARALPGFVATQGG